MGILVFMRNLLLALCLFLVLGFLYYSAWKLHLLRWEDTNTVVHAFDSGGHSLGSGRREKKSATFAMPPARPSQPAAVRVVKDPAPDPAVTIPKYDKQGFLLQLDNKLPAELASRFANFTEGACRPGYASALMTSIFPKVQRKRSMTILKR